MNKAVEKAFLFLSMRDHTVLELTAKLCRTFSKDEAQTAAEYLVENGYIDEENIARLRTDSYIRAGKSKKEIAGKLRMAGIEREIIESLCENINETEIIDRALFRKYASRIAVGDYKKVADSLMRRGFSYDKVRLAIEEIKNNNDY